MEPKDPRPHLVFAGVGAAITLLLFLFGYWGLSALAGIVTAIWLITGLVRVRKARLWAESRQAA